MLCIPENTCGRLSWTRLMLACASCGGLLLKAWHQTGFGCFVRLQKPGRLLDGRCSRRVLRLKGTPPHWWSAPAAASAATWRVCPLLSNPWYAPPKVFYPLLSRVNTLEKLIASIVCKNLAVDRCICIEPPQKECPIAHSRKSYGCRLAALTTGAGRQSSFCLGPKLGWL